MDSWQVVMEVEYLWQFSCWQSLLQDSVESSHAYFVPHIRLKRHEALKLLRVFESSKISRHFFRGTVKIVLDITDLSIVFFADEPLSVPLILLGLRLLRILGQSRSHHVFCFRLPDSESIFLQHLLMSPGPLS